MGSKKLVLFGLISASLILSGVTSHAQQNTPPRNTSQDAARLPIARVPILVELFTSEGCSSCPPADKLLQTMDTQPFPGVELVVLEEHVDYWDHDGWRDPYSSSTVTDRQKVYQQHLRFPETYTPQMVVDGTRQFNGSDGTAATAALKNAATSAKTPLIISAISVEPKAISVHIESAAIDQTGTSLAVYAALALDHAETDVKAGENADKHLVHASVERSLTRISTLKPGQPLKADIRLKKSADDKNLRIVVFLQDESSMKVYGAAMQRVR